MALVTLALFGPYLVRDVGLRAEQVAIYTIAVMTFPTTIKRAPKPWKFLMLTWCAIVAIAAVGGLWSPRAVSEGSGIYSGLDNLLIPAASASIALAWLARTSVPREPLLTLARWVAPLLALNALIMGLQQIADLTWLGWFWSSSGVADVSTVAGRAITNGRFTGIFNQPLEAGLAYGVGLFLLVYRVHHTGLSLWQLLMAGLLVVGGSLSISKVFILIALPLALLLFAYLERGHRGRLLLGAAVAYIPIVAVVAMTDWVGSRRLLRLFMVNANSDAVHFYSAGRFGSEGSLQRVVQLVIDHAPLWGFGAGGIEAPFDSAYVEMLVYAGITGLALYLSLLLAIALAHVKWHDRSSQALSLALLSLNIIAGLGGPTVTANRAGALLVLASVLALGYRFPVRGGAGGGGGAPLKQAKGIRTDLQPRLEQW